MKKKPLTTAQLSEFLDVEEPNIRTTINRLKEKNLVEETGMFADRYKIYRLSDRISNSPLLLQMLTKIKGVKAVALITNEGIPIASILPTNTTHTRYSAMSVAILSLSQRALKITKKGKFSTLYIEGEEGKLVIIDCGSEFVLTISLDNSVSKEDFFTQQFKVIELIGAMIAEIPFT